jgi:recombinational DNA repair protein (RecF pathway)
MNTCCMCKTQIGSNDTYEYRGALSCEDCFDDVIEMRDYQRNGIMKEEYNKTKTFTGLDMSDSIIGKANKKLLKTKIEIASKESMRLYEYERGE